eukprot:6983714-Prymnesium_polylepis.1
MLNELRYRLLQGDDGKAIVNVLRSNFTNTHTVKTYLLKVKKLVMQADQRHPNYDETVRALRTHESESEEIKEFLQAPLRVQYKIQMRHRKFKTWSRGAEAKLQRVKLLPANLESLKITKKETEDIKRNLRCTARERRDNVVSVPTAGDMLAYACAVLENATVKQTYTSLCCALALVSGRRCTEILNQRSTFVINGERTVIFTGQLKKSHGQSKPYTIPLLVDPKVFVAAMQVLRAKQGDKISALTDEQVQKKYNGGLTPKRIESAFWPGIPKFHFLRTCYAKFCDLLFHHTMTYNRLCCKVLGHSDDNQSLNYCAANLEDCDHLRRTFGTLRLE